MAQTTPTQPPAAPMPYQDWVAYYQQRLPQPNPQAALKSMSDA